MEDIVPELLESIQKSYVEEIKKNRWIKEFMNKIESENADYEDLLKYAKALGECLKNAFKCNVEGDILPDGKMYYNIAQRLIDPMIKKNYEIIAKQCAAVQTSLNSRAGLGLKGIQPSYKKEKTDSIINYISSAELYAEREKSFLDSLCTNAKSIVDDSVRENADFHYESGLDPVIIRRTNGETCKWCQNLVGVYKYADVKNSGNNVFRRHANCDCTVVYDPGNGSKFQNAWDKTWSNYDTVQEGKQRSKLADFVKKI